MSAAPAGTGTANADRPLEATMARDAIAAVAVAVAGADDMSSGLSGGRIGGGDASSSSIDDGGHAHGNHSPQHAAGDSIAALPDPATFITSEQEHKDPDDSYVYHHHHHHHHTTDRTSLHSSRDSLEMAALSDEDIALIGDEEEAGLTTKERRERRRRTRLRRRQQQQHGRDGGLDSSSSFSSSHDYEGRISEEGRRAADRLVVRNLAVNVVLILLWYFFSWPGHDERLAKLGG
ncbi:hypothetical protein KEM52_000547 [Ascosphaera acerosa]|nr:hypothetical protein KEM52_000547 [Ascosphaera acerosa]